MSRVGAAARACVQKAKGKLAGAKEVLSIHLRMLMSEALDHGTIVLS